MSVAIEGDPKQKFRSSFGIKITKKSLFWGEILHEEHYVFNILLFSQAYFSGRIDRLLNKKYLYGEPYVSYSYGR